MATFAAILLDDVLGIGVRPWLPASASKTCRIVWRFTGLDGKPVANRRTQFVNLYLPSLDDTTLIVGAFAEATTDALGEGSISLYRGAECEVVIDETSIVRRVTIPDAPFVQLVDLVSDAPDAFSIQRSQIVQPIRRSL